MAAQIVAHGFTKDTYSVCPAPPIKREQLDKANKERQILSLFKPESGQIKRNTATASATQQLQAVRLKTAAPVRRRSLLDQPANNGAHALE